MGRGGEVRLLGLHPKPDEGFSTPRPGPVSTGPVLVCPLRGQTKGRIIWGQMNDWLEGKEFWMKRRNERTMGTHASRRTNAHEQVLQSSGRVERMQ